MEEVKKRVVKPWLSTQYTEPIEQIKAYRRGLEKQREIWKRKWDIYYGTVREKKYRRLYDLLLEKHRLVGLTEEDLKRAEILPEKMRKEIEKLYKGE